MKTIQVTLSKKGISKAKQELRAYQKRLIRKSKQFVNELASIGIASAENHTGEFSGLITFRKEIDSTQFGAQAIMFATSEDVPTMWLYFGQVVGTDINPLLMAEFGSGWEASDASGQPNAEAARRLGMGQGSFPGQTHAFDKDGWWYKDLDGEWHNTTGITPSMPMWNALIAMENDIVNVARQVYQS